MTTFTCCLYSSLVKGVPSRELLNNSTMALTYLTVTYCFKLYEHPSRLHPTTQLSRYDQHAAADAVILKKGLQTGSTVFCYMKTSSRGIQCGFRIQGLISGIWALYNSQLQHKNNDKSSNFCESGSLFEPSKLIKKKTHFWHPTAKNFTTVQFHCVNKIVLESNIFILWILSDVLCVFDSTEVHFHYQFMRYIGLPSCSTDLQRHSSVLRVCMYNLYIRASYDIVLLQSTFTVFRIFPV
jgi:hypothetical protein